MCIDSLKHLKQMIDNISQFNILKICCDWKRDQKQVSFYPKVFDQLSQPAPSLLLSKDNQNIIKSRIFIVWHCIQNVRKRIPGNWWRGEKFFWTSKDIVESIFCIFIQRQIQLRRWDWYNTIRSRSIDTREKQEKVQ